MPLSSPAPLSQSSPLMRLGVCANRHRMPVDEYLSYRQLTPGQAAYNAIYAAACQWAHEHPDTHTVMLYYTGLTETTIAALDALHDAGIAVVPMFYDQLAGEYVPLRRGPATRGRGRGDALKNALLAAGATACLRARAALYSLRSQEAQAQAHD